ncbi:MAG: hypothetical protein ABJF01_09170 [bacterium]
MRLRARRSNEIEITGRRIDPASAPNTAYVTQLHGAPVSESAGHRPAAPTTFAINTPIIPPPAHPATTVKQPTPK